MKKQAGAVSLIAERFDARTLANMEVALDRACKRIIELENGRASSYTGNYSDYLVEREERREAQQRAYDNQQQLIAKTEEFIRRNLAGQKTKQAKSRRTLLAGVSS